MIQQGQERQIQRSGLMGERKFGIALSPKMYSMMSDGLYIDRVGSVVREVCSNAWDGQKMKSIQTGLPQEPFKVTLPTDLEPHFIVEDNGTGMPDDRAQDLYSTLGLSTKENTNDQIGAFGLGSKSPFAVTDTFTVENTYEGTTYHYLCFKAEDGLPSILKTGETQDGRPNGVTVKIPAAGARYLEYKRALNRQLIVMDPKPIIANIETFTFSDAQKAIETPEGFILANATDFGLYGRSVMARMGMVLYPVEMNQLDVGYYDKFHEKISGNAALILEFPIGALDPLPNREGLTYDDRTKANLTKAYKDFSASYMQILRKTVEEQPTPLDAWRKIQELKTSMNMDLSNQNIWNTGFKIDNARFVNDFPYFNHYYRESKLKPVTDYREDGTVVPPEYELVEKIASVSRFYFEEFSGSDTRLTTKREMNPMKMDFRTLNEIEKGNIKILIMDELDPKYRIGRMKSVLSQLGRSWSMRYWVVRVDSRHPGSKTDFKEFISSFEALHKGITKNFTWFSAVPKPEVERKKREDNGPIDGVTFHRSDKKWEDRIRFTEIDRMMTHHEYFNWDEENDGELPADFEQKNAEAKEIFLGENFYVLATRNDLNDYGNTDLKDLVGFAKEQGWNTFIVRKTGMGKQLKELKELGLLEFKDFINKKLDGHEVSDDYKMYGSAKKIIAQYPRWSKYAIKSHLKFLSTYLDEMAEFKHPFIAELERIGRLASLDSILLTADKETRLINAMRTKNLTRFFADYDWAKINEIDISTEFTALEASFEKYYPAFMTLASHLESYQAINPILAQYVTDYNAIRGDVDLVDFEETTTNEVKETE